MTSVPKHADRCRSGQVLARDGEYRKWLRSARHTAATELLAVGETVREHAAIRIGARYALGQRLPGDRGGPNVVPSACGRRGGGVRRGGQGVGGPQHGSAGCAASTSAAPVGERGTTTSGPAAPGAGTDSPAAPPSPRGRRGGRRPGSPPALPRKHTPQRGLTGPRPADRPLTSRPSPNLQVTGPGPGWNLPIQGCSRHVTMCTRKFIS